MPHSCSEPTRFLRYRFNSCAQARRHVHFLEGRQLLFIFDPTAELRERSRVLMAFCFTDSEKTATVPGEVCNSATGAALFSSLLPRVVHRRAEAV